MLRLGEKQTLTVEKLVDFGVYLTDGTDRVLLPRKEVPEDAARGDEITVFLYRDSKDTIYSLKQNRFFFSFVLLNSQSHPRGIVQPNEKSSSQPKNQLIFCRNVLCQQAFSTPPSWFNTESLLLLLPVSNVVSRLFRAC